MRKLFALLLSASMPLAGVAQSRAPVPVQPANTPLLEQLLGDRPLASASNTTRGIPLWGTSDGRILAIVSAGTTTPSLPQVPQLGSESAWRLIDVTQLISTGVRVRLGESANAHADLSQSTLVAPSCEAGKAGCAIARTVANGGQVRLGLNWLAGNDLDLDLYYGLSWLHHNNTPGTLALAGATALPGTGTSALPALAGLPDSTLPALLPGLGLADTQTSSLNAIGRLHLNDTQAFDFGASLSRIQLSIPGAAPLTSLNQAAVSFGMEYGAFSGTLTGHLLGANDLLAPGSGSPRLSGLDIGFSWRTPWRGRFSFGAQNLWSSGSLPLAPPVREGDANQARVPYVQYRQDL